jgi:hypothetical protein
MITVNVKGGLGNQMFQYACGRALALRNNDALRLVRSEYDGDTARQFSLTEFNIVANLDDNTRVSFITRWKERLKQKISGDFQVAFNPKILTLSGNIYLDGYFQSERYFKDQEYLIREDLTPKTPLTADLTGLAADIDNDQQAVSLHVRRGDYLNNKDFGNIASKKYYELAVTHIKAHVPEAKFYVFSDDITWCQSELALNSQAIFVSRPELRDFEELNLMSRCKHHIIANSSFSWWGAWLGNNPSKIVIAPKRWSNQHEEWYRDIIPSTWTRI